MIVSQASCQTVLNKMVDKWFTATNINEYPKNFDLYLSNRIQQVQISGKFTESIEIKAGVPQGFLDLNCFFLYINDLPLYIKYCLRDLFADDDSLHIQMTIFIQ